MNVTNYWVYILTCQNGAYYTGYTNNLLRRYKEHITGTGQCKYTRSFKPLQLTQSWIFADKSTAMKAEKRIKNLSKKTKQQLILNPDYLERIIKLC